jgi:hypothetical protein
MHQSRVDRAAHGFGGVARAFRQVKRVALGVHRGTAGTFRLPLAADG